MRILGIIPARGGSKGVPGKNIKILGQKPLIQYTIEAAKQSKLLQRIIVSTDDAEIAAIAKGAGAEVPFLRPASLATDQAASVDVVIHALESLMKEKEMYDAVCLLQPTAPFRPTSVIDAAIQKFNDGNYDSLISVLPVPVEFNPHWTFFADEHHQLHIATGDKQLIRRRQDLPNAYFRDGSIYLTRTNILLDQKSLYGNHIGYITSNPEYYVNIDTMDDWYKAEALLQKIKDKS